MMRRNRLDSLTTWKSPALSSDAISAPRRFARRLILLSAVAMALNGCQTLIDQSYQPSVSPSSNPQIVDEVQKNDPRAAMGAREHPRIVASYGGEYKDAKTERLVARITGALTAVSENPQQSYRITILNSPAINAFALPGGYLYVTRGLLALANDASEVAAVLSHEMGHVVDEIAGTGSGRFENFEEQHDKCDDDEKIAERHASGARLRACAIRIYISRLGLPVGLSDLGRHPHAQCGCRRSDDPRRRIDHHRQRKTAPPHHRLMPVSAGFSVRAAV